MDGYFLPLTKRILIAKADAGYPVLCITNSMGRIKTGE
jgi:hypothetical protein